MKSTTKRYDPKIYKLVKKRSTRDGMATGF